STFFIKNDRSKGHAVVSSSVTRLCPSAGVNQRATPFAYTCTLGLRRRDGPGRYCAQTRRMLASLFARDGCSCVSASVPTNAAVAAATISSKDAWLFFIQRAAQ